MKCNEVKTKKDHHFPDDQFLAQNVVKTKKVIWFADQGHENIGGMQPNYWVGYIPSRFAPMCVKNTIPTATVRNAIFAVPFGYLRLIVATTIQ